MQNLPQDQNVLVNQPGKWFLYRGVLLLVLLGLSSPVVTMADKNRVHMLLEQGQIEAARSQLEDLFEETPDDPTLLFTRAVIAEHQGEEEMAADIYTALTESHPAMIEAYNNLAIHHAENGNYKEAVVVLEAGLKSSPALATTFNNLTAIYARLASAAYRKALDSTSPLDPLALATIDRVEPSSGDRSCGHPVQ